MDYPNLEQDFARIPDTILTGLADRLTGVL